MRQTLLLHVIIALYVIDHYVQHMTNINCARRKDFCMKLKTSVIAAAVLSLTNITVAQAAQELSPEQAAELKPFERITVIGRFNAIYEAADAVSRRADKIGADSFTFKV